jgi:hypothetical protein
MADVAEVGASQSKIDEVCHRVSELKQLNQPQWVERAKIRDVMNNRKALEALVGRTIKDRDQRLPIANMIQRAVHVLGLKLGRRPDSKVDPPFSSDSDLAHKKADKRARIVDSLDRACNLEMMLPQIGRWTPGYGFAPAVLRQKLDRNDEPFPNIELRDPFHSFPGEWGAGQEPDDIAFAYVMTREKLQALYPNAVSDRQWDRAGGGVLLGPDSAGWSNQAGRGVAIYEYYDADGCWWVCPASRTLLTYTPNLLSGPQFRVAKRFCFDELTGMGDSAIGVMANMVRLALLATIATEDSVMAGLDVVGELRGGKYIRGRNAVNFFTPGTQVQRTNSRVPFEAFQQFDRLQDQLRLAVGHSRKDDGISPNSFVTGQGLQELSSSDGLEIREYFTVLTHFLQDIDSMRLEWLEKYYGDSTLNMFGVRAGAPFSETYVPSKDIAGNYQTRRVYGAMAGFDDATKIVTGLQLKQGKIIDAGTLREQIDGLENHQKIAERVLAEDAEDVLFASLSARAQQGDPLATQAAIGLLPEGKMKELLTTVFPPPPPPDQTAAAGAPPPADAVLPPGATAPPPAGSGDVQSVLSRLAAGGGVTANVQTVGRVS